MILMPHAISLALIYAPVAASRRLAKRCFCLILRLFLASRGPLQAFEFGSQIMSSRLAEPLTSERLGRRVLAPC